jgi:murein DD-endopeptidase MepM/ murein hydrolase activator NlpD
VVHLLNSGKKPSRPGAGGLFLCASRCFLVLLLLPGVAGCGPIPPPPVRGVSGTDHSPALPPPPAESPDAASASSPPATPPSDTDLGIPGVFHVVQPGQTVWRIAKTYGISLELLAGINQLEDPTVIETGQRIFIPGADRLLEVDVYQPQDRPAKERTGDISLQWPLTGTITSRFGGGRRHTGLDIAAPRNTPVLAAADGEVTYSGNGLRGYGNLVVIDHGKGVVTLYAHNNRNLVRKGERVRRGDRIARVGSTGHSTGPHVHFEVLIDGQRVDPQRYLD